FDLMFNLDATEEQLDFVTIYGSSKQGWMSTDWNKPTTDIFPLLDAVVENIPGPERRTGIPRIQITSLDFSSFVGRIAIGRIYQGTLKEGATMGLCKKDGSVKKVKIKELQVFEGLGKLRVQEV